MDRNGRVAGTSESVDLADALRRGGYNTWHVGKWHVSGRPSTRGCDGVATLFGSGGGQCWKGGQVDWKGFPITGYRGWIFQEDDRLIRYPELGIGVTPDISQKFADVTISLLKSPQEKPWFCHVNFTAPHDQLFMPPGLSGKYSAKNIPLPKNFLPVYPLDHGNFDGRDEALLAWPRTEEAVKDLLRVYYCTIEDMDAQIGWILNRPPTITRLNEYGYKEKCSVQMKPTGEWIGLPRHARCATSSWLWLPKLRLRYAGTGSHEMHDAASCPTDSFGENDPNL